jgi:tetratricopeptide (TPR) repeat protein
MEKNDKEKVNKEIDKLVKSAENFNKKGKMDKAIEKYQEAAKLAVDIGDRRALDFCLEAAKNALKMGDTFKTGWAYKTIAEYAFKLNDFDNVINFASKATEYFLKVNEMYVIQWCYNIMGEAYEKMGDYEKAIEMYKKSLEIEYSEDIQNKINKLSEKSGNLKIEHKCSKPAAKEGEKVEVILKITNTGKEVLNDIKICNEKGKEVESIPILKPGESKCFKYNLLAWEGAKPLYKKIIWKNKKGEKREKDIELPLICIVPNIDVKASVDVKLEVGKQSYFSLFVINNSKEEIKNIDLNIKFPIDFKVHPVTGYYIDKLSPGEEKGFVFKILPTITGKTIIKPSISFTDTKGRKYIKNVGPFVLEEILPSKRERGEEQRYVSKNNFERLKYTQKFKRYIENLFRPKEMEETDYVKLAKQLYASVKGFTLKDVSLEDVAKHVIEECRSMHLVSVHEGEDEKLYLFSAENNEGNLYLLTVVLKEENDMIHIAFKLFSENEEENEDLIEKISDIIKHTIIAFSLATEVQKIEIKETINIIDSIVQRSKIGERKKDKELNIEDSVVQRTEV